MSHRKHALFIFAAAVLSLGAHAQTPRDPKVIANAEKHYKPTVKRDDFDKSVSISLEIERLYVGPKEVREGADCWPVLDATVSLVYFKPSNSAPFTMLYFGYDGADWMFISKDEPLRILAGDSIRAFPASGDPSRDVVEGGVLESQDYEVTSDDLAWLGSQPDARLRVTGDKSNCNLPLTPEALAMAGMFNDRVVRDSASVAAH